MCAKTRVARQGENENRGSVFDDEQVRRCVCACACVSGVCVRVRVRVRG